MEMEGWYSDGYGRGCEVGFGSDVGKTGVGRGCVHL